MFRDAKGNLRPILDIINDIKNATAPTDRAATFIDIFEARAGAAALAITGSSDTIDDFRDRMENAMGTADEMARTMADNLRGDWIAFRSAIEGVQIAIGEAINDTARKWLQRLTTLTRGLVDIITVNRDFLGRWWSYILEGWDALQNDLGATIVGGWLIATGINNAISGIKTFWNNLIAGIQEAALFAVRFIVRQFAWTYAKIRGLNTEEVMNQWTAGLDNTIVGVEERSASRAADIEAGRRRWQQSLDDAAIRSLSRVDQVRNNAPKTNDRIEQLKLEIEALRNPATKTESDQDKKTKDKNEEIKNLVSNLSTTKSGSDNKGGLSGTFSAFEMENVKGNIIEDTLNKQLKLQQETNISRRRV
jgi:hypothetical protein